MDQKEKAKFRATKVFKTFRKDLKKEQKIDPITLSKLSTRCNCHHRDLNPLHYKDLSDKTHFVMYNNYTHKFIHYCWNVIAKYPDKYKALEDLLDRLRKELTAMILINDRNDLH